MDTKTVSRAQTLQWTVGQIALSVRDLEKSIGFYRDTLGMRFLFSSPTGMAFFDCDGIRLMLSASERPEFSHASSKIYFTVNDIQAAYSSLRERGVHFFDKPHVINETDTATVWMAFFSDFDRNVLGIMSEVPKT